MKVFIQTAKSLDKIIKKSEYFQLIWRTLLHLFCQTQSVIRNYFFSLANLCFDHVVGAWDIPTPSGAFFI